MSWADLEFSLSFSRPVTLYEFAVERPSGWEYFRYSGTRSEEIFPVQSFGGVTEECVFTPTHISYSNLKQNTESVYDIDVDITVGKDNPVALMFRNIVPQRTVWLKIYSAQRDAPDEIKAIWVGRIRQAELIKGSAVKLMGEPIGTMVKRGGLRMNGQVLCNHFLYSPSCSVNPEQTKFKAEGVVASSSQPLRGVIYCDAAAAYADGWFDNGTLELGDHFYMILTHRGSFLKLFNPIEKLNLTGTSISLYAGCDHEYLGTHGCVKKFGNGVNFGAFPWMPNDDPYTTGVGI